MMNRVVLELGEVFRELQIWKSIYTVPVITELDSRHKLELQIADGGSDYTSALQGGIRREQFHLIVGVMYNSKLDRGGDYQRTLRDENESIHAYKERVIDELEGNYLLDDSETELIVNPLRIIRESPVHRSATYTGLLIKELDFLGGEINTRSS